MYLCIFRIEVCLVSQMYEDNGYTYKPATQCLQWLQAYFSCNDKKESLALPKVCSHIGKEGNQASNMWLSWYICGSPLGILF